MLDSADAAVIETAHDRAFEHAGPMNLLDDAALQQTRMDAVEIVADRVRLERHALEFQVEMKSFASGALGGGFARLFTQRAGVGFDEMEEIGQRGHAERIDA